MEIYEIVGEDKEKVKGLIQSLDLESCLSMRYPHDTNSCPLNVYCKIGYDERGGEDFPNGRLTIYINESRPEIKIRDAKSIHFQYGDRYLASFIISGVLIEIEDESVEEEEISNDVLKDIVSHLADLKYEC